MRIRRGFRLCKAQFSRAIGFTVGQIRDFIQRVRRSFRTKLLLLLIAAIIIPTTIAGIYLGNRLTGQINQTFSQQLNSELSTFGMMLNTEWEELHSVLARLATDNTVQKNIQFETGFIQRYLNEQRLVSELDWLYLHQANVPNVTSGMMGDNMLRQLRESSDDLIIRVGDQSYLIDTVPVVAENDTLALLSAGINLRSDESVVRTIFQDNKDAPVIWWKNRPIDLESNLNATDIGNPQRLGVIENIDMDERAFVGLSGQTSINGQVLTLSIYREVDGYQATIRSSIVTIVVTLGIVIALFVYIGLGMVNTIARPLNTLTSYTRGLVADTFQPAGTELVTQISKTSTDEIGELAGAFQNMQSQLERYIEDLKVATEQQERINSELRIARNIQMNMLPGDDEVAGFEQEFDVATAINPARQVGGDLYDLFSISEHQYGIVIGDVADKGIPAALFMAMSKTLVRAVTMLEYQQWGSELQPNRILEQIGRELQRNNKMFMFVTLFLGIIDTRNDSLKYASAGHNPPIWIRSGGTPQYLPQKHGVPLGIRKKPEYVSQSIAFKPNDLLVLYTDGIVEAENQQGEFYGDDELMKKLTHQQKSWNSESLLNFVQQNITNFSSGHEQSDDQTLVVLKRKCDTEERALLRNHPRRMVNGQSDKLGEAFNVLEDFLADHLFTDEVKHDLSLILEEYVMNVVKHGYQGEQHPWLEVSFDNLEEVIELEIQDNATPFDLNTVSMGWLKERSASDDPGEHGLLIIRSLAESIDYQSHSGYNRCVIRYKKYQDSKGA